jgi:E3 ubiquitin-protein ligase HECTD2
MAPWSSRTNPPNSHNQQGPSTADTQTGSPTKSPVSSRVTEADILENAYGIPTLQPLGSSKPKRPGHGRSVSHPFPSLFNGKKKHASETPNGFETTGDDAVSPAQVRQITQNPAAKQVKVPDKDLLTGKCMTCDSMVRWPKNLHVFRCTVCLTINDLKPLLLEARQGDGHRVVVKAGNSSSHSQRGRLVTKF